MWKYTFDSKSAIIVSKVIWKQKKMDEKYNDATFTPEFDVVYFLFFTEKLRCNSCTHNVHILKYIITCCFGTVMNSTLD